MSDDVWRYNKDRSGSRVRYSLWVLLVIVGVMGVVFANIGEMVREPQHLHVTRVRRSGTDGSRWWISYGTRGDTVSFVVTERSDAASNVIVTKTADSRTTAILRLPDGRHLDLSSSAVALLYQYDSGIAKRIDGRVTVDQIDAFLSAQLPRYDCQTLLSFRPQPVTTK
jgi:hypothetical protein